MDKIVLDSNVIFHLNHPKIQLLEKFIRFCEEKDVSIIMSENVLNECPEDSKRLLEGNRIFKKISVEKSKVDDIRKICESLYKPIHTKKDNDYRVLTVALETDADIIFTNDHDLITSIKEYKRNKSIPKDKMAICMTTNLLWLMYKRKKGFFEWHENISSTIKLHHHVELPNHVKNFCKYVETDYLLRSRREKQIKKGDRERYEKHLRERFTPYAQNIYNTITDVISKKR